MYESFATAMFVLAMTIITAVMFFLAGRSSHPCEIARISKKEALRHKIVMYSFSGLILFMGVAMGGTMLTSMLPGAAVNIRSDHFFNGEYRTLGACLNCPGMKPTDIIRQTQEENVISAIVLRPQSRSLSRKLNEARDIEVVEFRFIERSPADLFKWLGPVRSSEMDLLVDGEILTTNDIRFVQFVQEDIS